MSQNFIPLVDLKAANAEIEERVAEAISGVIKDACFIGGPAVRQFELDYAAFSGIENVIGVGNGTDALELALRGVGLRPGDEVILPVNTFIATPEAVIRAGGVPVYVDVTDDGLLDVEAVEDALSPRTTGIIPVHLYGQMPDMAAVQAIAERHGLFVVEDAAQAQGSEQRGRPAGSFGAAAATSFYPGKNLGAFGDAGAVLTGDADLAHRVRMMANHGSDRRYVHEILGFNSRLDTIQAVVLSAKLRNLADANLRRRKAASRYDALLKAQSDVIRPREVPGNVHIWHLYVVHVPEGRRDSALADLHKAGIQAGMHYPVPLHLSPATGPDSFKAGKFPNAERLAATMISLPIFPQITSDQQDRVARALRTALGS